MIRIRVFAEKLISIFNLTPFSQRPSNYKYCLYKNIYLYLLLHVGKSNRMFDNISPMKCSGSLSRFPSSEGGE